MEQTKATDKSHEEPQRLLLRPEEVARAIGLSRSKVYELMQSGSLPTVRIGSAVRVPVAALNAWVNERIADAAQAR